MERLYRYINQGMRARNGQRGLTLVEILVVVTALGILTGTVTLSLVSVTSHARVQSCDQGRPTVQAAIGPNRPTTISTPLSALSSFLRLGNGGGAGAASTPQSVL